MDQFKALRYFSKVAETGSFTKAAGIFGVPLHRYQGEWPI